MDRSSDLHDRDFFAWSEEQAAELRRAAEQRVNLPIDWLNLAEEVEDMGRTQRAALASDLARILEHLLKLEHSPAAEPRGGWADSVVEHRGRVEFALDESPSLARHLPTLLDWAWKHGRRHAVRGLQRNGIAPTELPATCPYPADRVIDPDWWPENRHGLGTDPG
jgi:hypothetical protein